MKLYIVILALSSSIAFAVNHNDPLAGEDYWYSCYFAERAREIAEDRVAGQGLKYTVANSIPAQFAATKILETRLLDPQFKADYDKTFNAWFSSQK